MCLGIPGRIVEVRDSAGLRMAVVDFGGVRREVCLEYTPEADVGTFVIVHVGFAITTVDEAEAERTLDVLRAMAGAVEGELGEPLPEVAGAIGAAVPAAGAPGGGPGGDGQHGAGRQPLRERVGPAHGPPGPSRPDSPAAEHGRTPATRRGPRSEGA